jgi:hypothetical protein
VAAVGLLGVTLVSLARPVFDLYPALLIGSAAVVAAERFGVSPLLLLAATAGIGAGVGAMVL